MMDTKIYFTLWYGPQYPFGYGIANGGSIEVTWLEKIGVCAHAFTSLAAMFKSVAKHQGWTRTEGLTMTLISQELYEIEMEVKAKANEPTENAW